MERFMEKYAERMLKFFAGFMLIASIIMYGILCAETAEAKTYAKCEVVTEDPVWIYDTYKINVENFESHHVGSYKLGKRFKVYETKKGFGRIKYKGKKAWIPTKNLEVISAGYIKIEGKWKRVKPGFDFWLYIKYGEETKQ